MVLQVHGSATPAVRKAMAVNTLPREYRVIALGSQRNWGEDTHVALNIELKVEP